MLYPRHTIGVHTYSAGESDGYGGTTPVYTPPLHQPGTPHQVYGWVVPASSEPKTRGSTERVIVDVEVFAPADLPIGPYDLVDLPDGQYWVIGQPEDYNHGPFGATPGLVVNLRRVEG